MDGFIITADRRQIVYHGNVYNKHLTHKGSTYWRCRLAYKRCRARIVSEQINGRETIKRADANIHNH